MAARRSGSTRNETIRCPYCGEDYAASYRHCPFCDELPLEEDYDEEEAPRSRSRSGPSAQPHRQNAAAARKKPVQAIRTEPNSQARLKAAQTVQHSAASA